VSSFFSVPAYAAGVASGVEPVGQVIGVSACYLQRGVLMRTRGHGDWSRTSARWHELTGPVSSWNTARREAIGRVVEQATALGGDAVLDVSVDHRQEEFSDTPVVEVILTGTAVRLARRLPRKEPVVATVSPQELERLRAAGVDPVGLAGAFASISVTPSQATRRTMLRSRSAPNQELEDFTTGIYEARRLVMERLRRDAGVYGANGVIGVDIGSLGDDRISGEGMVVTVHAFGTAVRARVRGEATLPRPVLGAR
jgi:uncharacterized protein YbjQ (UPF0145 family)